MLGSNGEKKDTTLAKLLPYLMISGTGEDDMPDMGLIAEAIMDPEGKGASSFFTEMSMKNILMIMNIMTLMKTMLLLLLQQILFSQQERKDLHLLSKTTLPSIRPASLSRSPGRVSSLLSWFSCQECVWDSMVLANHFKHMDSRRMVFLVLQDP